MALPGRVHRRTVPVESLGPQACEMPYEIAWEPAGVYRTYRGQVTERDRRVSLEVICGDRRFDRIRYAITDFLGADELVASDRATLELAALNIGPLITNPTLVLAAVAIDPAHLQYLERIKSHGFIRAPYETFPSTLAARQWVALRTGIAVPDQSGSASTGG